MIRTMFHEGKGDDDIGQQSGSRVEIRSVSELEIREMGPMTCGKQ
jgi:hypothetical protein